ncbi:MAG: DUF4398 domain-containing protein [Desulfobacteraceae bacterium]
MKNASKTRYLLSALAIMATALVVGCTSVPLKTETTESSIRAAEEVGAAKLPQASLHLQLAKEELDRANQLFEKGDKEEAASLLLRADSDAELAVTLSHGDAEKREAELAMARVRKLQQENP